MSCVLDVVRAAKAALARADIASLEQLDDDTYEAVLVALSALRSTLDALWLRAAAGADQRSLHRQHQCRDTASWLAQLSGDRQGQARRDIELAAALASAPQVAEIAGAHALSKAKTAELARAATLPSEVIDELGEAAAGQSVEQVAAAVRRARLEYDVIDPPVEPSCELSRSHDRVRLTATVDLVDGEHLQVALDAYAEAAKLPKDQCYAQRRAKALVGLARHYLDHNEELPATRVGRPHVLVIVDLPTLQAPSGGRAALASGTVISGDEARRLAEEADVCRVVTAGRSLVLDVGRSTRTVPHHLAKAVIARDRHCTHEGCDAPPWACEIHHVTHWANGGRTALDNLELRCWHHHHEHHRHQRDGPVESRVPP